MTSWGRAEHKAGKFLKELDADDLHDQLDSMRAYLKDLTGTFGKIANRQWGRAREQAVDTAQEAEDLMKDNLAASLIVALGVGVLVGYMIRRGSE
jgi:ElaB/YqjD/DUF883 family membrane-anchored ribosome-binding protein